MRGLLDEQQRLFFTIDVESRIRKNHPLRDVKVRVDRILEGMSEVFSKAYSSMGRPGVPPEQLVKALLLMALYSIRSERQLVERIDTDLLFRWFLNMDPSEEMFDATVFTYNRKRFEEHNVIPIFFEAVLDEAIQHDLCSEHFSVDGTLIESLASTKSFQPIEDNRNNKDDSSSENDASSDGNNNGQDSDGNAFKPRNAEVNFHGQKRSNATHESKTDPEAKLYRKGNGQPALLYHTGHAITENRNGLIMQVTVTEANGTVERKAAMEMLDEYQSVHGHMPTTLGADKGYDAGDFLLELEAREIEPHVAIRDVKRDPNTVTRKQQPAHEARLRMQERRGSLAYQLSQKTRKKVEECFGWLKSIAGLDRARHVGRWKIQQQFELGATAFNLIRLRKLAPAS